MPAFRRLSLMTVLVVVIAACGGGSDPGTTSPGGTQPGPTSTADPGGTPAPTTTPPPGGDVTTTPPPGGDDVGSVTVEIDGETYELSLRKDIESQIPGYMHQTMCLRGYSTGDFTVVAIAVAADGTELIPGYSLYVKLNVDGTADPLERGFEFKDDVKSIVYELVRDNPGTWTVTDSRLEGELNVSYFDDVARESGETTARIDANCPVYEG